MIGIVILFVVLFSLLVFVHELGHFVAAKRSGIAVEEFGFGFPPRLIGKKVGSTIYSVNALPLGGFVRMKGEDNADRRPGSFGAASFGNKTKVLLAGVAMNGLTAFLIFLGLAIWGLPPVLPNQFNIGHAVYVQPKELMVIDVIKGSPAEQVGIHTGDFITAAGGRQFTEEKDLINFTKSHAGDNMSITVMSHGQTRTVQAKLNPPGSKKGYLGITPLQTYKARYGIWAPAEAAGLLGQTTWATLAGLGGVAKGLPGLIKAAPAKKAVDTAATGPIGIFYLITSLRDFGIAYLMVLVAGIAVALMTFNALPIPALDGGRWFLLLIQKITRIRIPSKLENKIHTYGFLALITLLLFISINDWKRFH